MNDKKKLQLLYYTRQKMPILPLHWLKDDGACSCGNPKCGSAGKHPLTQHGLKDATVDQQQVKAWHKQFPTANWGMRTGSRSSGGAGVLVIDIDPRHGGDVSWEMLEQEDPDQFRFETIEVKTGNGGIHHWLRYPDGVDVGNSAGKLGSGIDIRGNNGYVVIPPSHTTNDYEFKIRPGDVPLAPMPDAMLAMLNGKPRTQVKAPSTVRGLVPVGSRHGVLLSTAGKLVAAGMSVTTIRNTLHSMRDNEMEAGDHLVTDEEIDKIIDHVKEKIPNYTMTDLGNSERFVAQHGDGVRYVHEWQQWLVWDGKRWNPDTTDKIITLGHLTARSIYREAADESDPERRKRLASHAVRTEAMTRVNAMLKSSEPYLAIKPNMLDRDPYKLNVKNGTIDLKFGDLKPHDKNDFITKLIDIEFDQQAVCPAWYDFLKLITGGDQELELFLQLSVGYTLTGLTDEHCLFFLYGSGLNGKTTFVEAMRHIFGDYSTKVDIESMMGWRSGDAANPYVATMSGARLVVASEIPENRKLNESLVKDLTGSDTMTARFLFANPFEFKPTHKLWIYGNHKPRITGTDEGIWRRLRLCPFMVRIPDDVRLPFGEVMKMFQQEEAGILAWAVLGASLYYNMGLESAPAVQDATAEYRTESDLIAQFLEEQCDSHPDYECNKKNVYRAWREWLEDNGEKDSRSQRWFTRQLTNRGYEIGGGQNKNYIGLKLR